MKTHNYWGFEGTLNRCLCLAVAGAAVSTGCVVKSSDKDTSNQGGSSNSAEGGSDAQTTNGGTTGTTTLPAAGGTQAASGGTTGQAAAGADTVAGTSGIAAGTAGAISVGSAGQAGAPASASNPCTAADPGNDTRELATPYDLGSTFVACLQTASDVDFYEFTAPTTPVDGGVVQVSLIDVATTGGLDSSAFVVSDNGELQNAYGSSGTNVYYWFGIAAGAKYRISVARFSSFTSAAAYTVKTTYIPVNDTHEPNDLRTAATPITVGTAVEGFFFAGYRVSTGFETNAWEDWYKLTAAAGNLTVTLDNLASDINGDIELFNGLGTSIKNAYATTNGSTVVLSETAVAAGDYYLKVTPFSNKSPKGAGSVLPQYITQPYVLKVTQ